MTDDVEVLVIEDSEADAFLIIRELMRFLPNAKCTRIETPQQLTEALKRKWDVVLCDFNLPEFDALTALRQIRESGTDVPFILVSGLVEEGIAASMMRLGAKDYIMKENLKRLGPAVIRELQEARLREELRQGQAEPQVLRAKPPVKGGSGASGAAYGQGTDLLQIIESGTAGMVQGEGSITERHKAVVNILYAAGLIKKHQNRILEENNLTEQKLNLLLVLSRHYPESITVNTLKQEIVNKTSDISRLIERMAKLALIHYTQNKQDKRARNIAISIKGQEVLNAINAQAENMFLDEELLPENSARLINEELKKIMDAMDA